ncbi:MAG: transcription termination/antitermination NusG family protein [Acidobacteriota bacterium]|nr:transcription termination/antitermination NusG family protein [Acidobacteriota bacterium]
MASWYVVQTKPKKEFHVEKLFQEAGLPVYNPRSRDGGRIKPFFAGYQFVFFDYPAQYKLVKYTRGVRALVGNAGGPIPIDEAWIEEIRSREVEGYIEVQKYGLEPSPGDEVEVAAGPLKGLRGVFQTGLSDQDRVLILLNCVSYQGRLLIEKDKLKKVVI